eukprot:scaffold6734_cov23-Tisochrysis_lutea.AAC.1
MDGRAGVRHVFDQDEVRGRECAAKARRNRHANRVVCSVRVAVRVFAHNRQSATWFSRSLAAFFPANRGAARSPAKLGEVD